MAVAVLGEGGGAVRLHVGSLHSLLVMIDEDGGLPPAAREVARRWLADIDADLGYVTLDRSLLGASGASGGAAALHDALRLAIDDLSAAPLPRALAARTPDPEALRGLMLEQARALVGWLAR